MIIDNARPTNVVKAFGLIYPDVLRLRGSVIRISFPPVLLMTSYGVGIAFLIREYPGLAINMTVLSLVSLVLSLLLVFRTNSAYDRFWEGRRTWQEIKVTSRNLIRSLWVGVAENSIEDSVHKRQAMKNIAAFAISVKHYLRDEDGIEHADFDGLLSPEFRLQCATHGSGYNYGSIPVISSGSPDTNATRMSTAAPNGTPVYFAQRINEGWERHGDIPLPSQLLFELQKFIEYIQDNKLIHVQFYASLLTTLNNLASLMGGCERILSTPIPLAYRVHLNHGLYMYLLVLPWALGSMGLAKTIIFQFIISFLMIGIDSISREIQNPFGYDANDLPLDSYCESILVELSYALQRRAPKSLEVAENTLSQRPADNKATVTASASCVAVASAVTDADGI
ncbi:hypothetical protein GGI01_001719 [Coemansia sp. RSA 376]|nr:hypothetical protein LPJ71_005572 [Coemansia sp. S17]KAJ2032881.1 hypothetical protein H4S03_006037 [Coemansia sp. S3946]KAJ2056218.1 hypothetical protein GGH13_007614 [Coemansia sp. S155-1]KAJ2098295.1 hypothetical protein GGI16_004322 [Coemansia sp. S142-1]KAJ2262187.1 hypothetical protein GGI01_001719 [Coemansia sp. RSA 376]